MFAHVFEHGGLAAGETLLVHGATSGIGATAIQMAKAAGAKVVATARGALKAEQAKALGADLAMMGAVGKMLLGIDSHVMTAVFAIVSLTLQMFVPYRRYSSILKWLTLVLLAYFAVLLFVHLDWGAVLAGLVVPRIANAGMITTIVALFGTTISPYLFFWQSAQEVEEVKTSEIQEPLIEQPWQARREFRRIWFDTLSGMGFSTLVALAIMIATAATLHARGIVDIQSAAQAAQALEPAAGPFAFLLFALGIIGTGMLAIPILAGSAAYAIGDTRGWEAGLDFKPWEAVGFYGVIAAATLLGIAIDWSGLDPIKALFWSAVLNGIVAVPIMVAMMVVVNRSSRMGKFTAPRSITALGWSATLVMGVAVAAMWIF